MADKKITALPDLGNQLASEDLLHVVDSPSSNASNKKISVQNVFNNLPTWIGLKTFETVNNTSSTINVTDSTTLIDGGSNTYSLGLEDGSIGQIKLLIMTTSGTVTVTPTNLAPANNIVFQAAGQAAMLFFINSSWQVISLQGSTLTN